MIFGTLAIRYTWLRCKLFVTLLIHVSKYRVQQFREVKKLTFFFLKEYIRKLFLCTLRIFFHKLYTKYNNISQYVYKRETITTFKIVKAEQLCIPSIKKKKKITAIKMSQNRITIMIIYSRNTCKHITLYIHNLKYLFYCY